MRVNLAWADPEQLNRENQTAIARLGYDPNTEERRPSAEEMQRAAKALFARIKKLPQS